MLFNSYTFILLFLPLTLAGFFAINHKFGEPPAIAWLVVASLFFYGWWDVSYMGLILVSILFNYGFGLVLARRSANATAYLAVGVVGNLALLGYFKYANFFVDNVNAISGSDFLLAPILLPLAISFFTFQQVAYLVDAHRGETREYSFLHYCLFVSFFPQLIAGPIVHHGEMMPQFAKPGAFRLNYENLAVGITIFSIGLFKKVILADSLASYASPVFDAAEHGAEIAFFEGWGGALAYTFQLYFDFSGYSDMAIGIARMFNIRLPLNFNSPYKATSIIDFWRCWHMTLSRFLRDYLYIAIGGGRCGVARRHANLLVTMLLGGLWHGASWTFVAWGALHGIYLMINHGWRAARRRFGLAPGPESAIGRWTARTVTFGCVAVGWVFFRAESFDGASTLLAGMAGFNGLALPERLWALLGMAPWGIFVDRPWLGYFGDFEGWIWITAAWTVAWLLPNTQTFMAAYQPALDTYPGAASRTRFGFVSWQPTHWWLAPTLAAWFASILYLNRASEFLYFQF